MSSSFQRKLSQKLNTGKLSKKLHRIIQSLIEIEKLLNIR